MVKPRSAMKLQTPSATETPGADKKGSILENEIF
jgi:hypothetical protein